MLRRLKAGGYGLLYGRSVVNNYAIQLDRDELIGMLKISLNISFVRLIEDGH
jgi:hypothetical protein